MMLSAAGKFVFRLLFLCLLGIALTAPRIGRAQEPKHPVPGSIPISFLPPPLEHATYSLGIFDAATNHLVRRLREFAQEKDFTVGLNGLLTTWDGQDDHGKPVPPGRYAARGYAVGALKIEGENIQGNDWAAAAEDLRLKQVIALALVPRDGGVLILGTLSDGTGLVARFSGQGELLWRKPVAGYEPKLRPWLSLTKENVSFMPRLGKEGTDDAVVGTESYRLGDGQADSEHGSGGGGALHVSTPPLPPVGRDDVAVDRLPAADSPATAEDAAALVRKTPLELRGVGKDRTAWVAAGAAGLVQTDRSGAILRRLNLVPGDPLPRQVSASDLEDRLYILETRPGWQRVRGLVWQDTKEENGRPVSTWQTFFERSIRSPATPAAAAAPVETTLTENPLTPGKPPKLRLTAAFDARGSYLSAENGLRLRRISERANLESARLARGKAPGTLSLFQSDGAATDEFSIKGVHGIMEFDAGEFEMTATGEKPADPKTAEPPDL